MDFALVPLIRRPGPCTEAGDVVLAPRPFGYHSRHWFRLFLYGVLGFLTMQGCMKTLAQFPQPSQSGCHLAIQVSLVGSLAAIALSFREAECCQPSVTWNREDLSWRELGMPRVQTLAWSQIDYVRVVGSRLEFYGWVDGKVRHLGGFGTSFLDTAVFTELFRTVAQPAEPPGAPKQKCPDSASVETDAWDDGVAWNW